MIKQMLLALGLCYALMVNNSNAQSAFANETFDALDKGINYRDTIMIIPDSTCKVLLIGKELNEMINYSAIDSIKNLLIADVEKARKQAAYPAQAKLTYYFVHPNGKRRLKAESEDYMEPQVNVDDEERSLYLDLPPYEFIVYDFKAAYRCQIYLKNPNDLKKLASISFKDALVAASLKKKTVNKSYRIDLTKSDDNWKVENSYANKLDEIELGYSAGLSLIGSRWCPMIDLNLSLILNDKYRHPQFKIGLAYGIYSYADWNKTEITNLAYLSSYDLRMMFNLSLDKQKWIGIQGGLITTGFESQSSLYNKFKMGIVSEGLGPLNLSLDVIFIKKKEALYSLTLKFPF